MLMEILKLIPTCYRIQLRDKFLERRTEVVLKYACVKFLFLLQNKHETNQFLSSLSWKVLNRQAILMQNDASPKQQSYFNFNCQLYFAFPPAQECLQYMGFSLHFILKTEILWGGEHFENVSCEHNLHSRLQGQFHNLNSHE